MLNKQIVTGRLTHTPELKTTQSGVSVCSFTIASDEDIKREDGTRDTDFVDCVAWRGKADFVSRYFTKGQMITIVGRPKKRSYEDKNGVKHTVTETRVDEVYFADSKRAEGAEQSAPAAATPIAQGGFMEVDDDDDLPFA